MLHDTIAGLQGPSINTILVTVYMFFLADNEVKVGKRLQSESDNHKV